MHIVEMKWRMTSTAKRLGRMLGNILPEIIRNSWIGRAFNKVFHLLNELVKACLNCYDRIHFWLSHPACESDPISRETARLVHSWATFSDEYLKLHHGQDYSHPSRIYARKILKQIVDSHNPKANALKVLDVPCGNGTDYQYIFSRFSLEYEGLELNPKQVRLNRDRLPGVNFNLGNIMSLEAQDCTYDIVYCRHIFEHLSLDAMDLAIKETYRVARKYLLYVFFSMEDIGGHKEVPVRLYHCNVLSRSLVEKKLRSLDRVRDVQVERISQVADKDVIEAFKRADHDNYLFLVLLEDENWS